MLQTEKWLGEHADIGASAGNRVLNWICVPVLVTSLVGLLWSLPVPAIFSESSPVLNWGTLFLMAAVVYYFILSISLAFGILPFVVLVATVIGRADALEVPLAPICGAMFLAAWGAQMVGRWATGKPLRPVNHLQHVMIGPIWLLASVYRRLGIPY